jgi:hypothetical protein
MLDGGYDGSFTTNRGGQAGVDNLSKVGMNDRTVGYIHTNKPDSMVDRRRVNRKVDFFAGMKSDATATD